MSVLNVSISPVHVYIVYPKIGKHYLHLRVVSDLNHCNPQPLWQKMIHHLFGGGRKLKLRILKGESS